MTTNKLSAKFCDTAPKGNHFDGDGLYLLVKPDGKRYWRMACYLQGKRKLLSFGKYPLVSLEKARKARINAQELLMNGIDPTQYARDQKLAKVQALRNEAQEKGHNFEQTARRLHEAKSSKTSEEYRNKMLRQLEIHVFPSIGHKHMDEITSNELLALFTSIAKKTNHGRPMTYMAKKLCQWCSEVFDFAQIENTHFTKNPCRIIIKHLPDHDTKHMARILFKDLPRFLNDLNKYNGHAFTKAAIWMLLYTGMRQASVRRALIRDFDLKNAVWNRRPEKSDKLAHPIPLPRQAIKLIKDTLPHTGGEADDLAFPSNRGVYQAMSEAAICRALDRMGYHMVGHGLRGVVSTGLNELGFKPHVVEVQLGHKKESTVEAAYNDAKHFAERRIMMQTWADYLEKAVKKKQKKA